MPRLNRIICVLLSVAVCNFKPVTMREIPVTAHEIGSILNTLAGKVSEDTRKKGKGTKTAAAHDWRSFYLA